ncbi:MAG: chemotaxis protein CheA [Synergistetes bacterium]|nr:chemotaxis protein CheA [Synergistota bacterium]MDW8193054.1 chemotaxis protein CheA [Synergistota bacterium]
MGMSQYLQVFLDESAENLQRLNELILELEKDPSNTDLLNEVFRIAHTLKGMSATMGFDTLAELTHEMENLLDKLRKGELTSSSDVVDVLFECLDVLEAMIEEIRNTGRCSIGASSTITKLRVLSGEREKAPPETVKAVKAPSLVDIPMELNEYDKEVIKEAFHKSFNVYKIKVTLDEGCLLKAARAYIVFHELGRIGEIIKSLPPVEDIEEEKFENEFTLLYVSKEGENVIRSKIEAVSEIKKVEISRIEPEKAEVEKKVVTPSVEIKEEEVEKVIKGLEEIHPEPEAVSVSPVEREKLLRQKVKGMRTIRVDIDRLDDLMNLVGELVINKTRLVQIGSVYKLTELDETLAQIGRITNELQAVVMKLRMVPIEHVFNRFPRMVRDLAREEGKEVEFIIEGKETELDRTVIDEIGDPLVHLLRNAIDHGIEPPAERERLGKPPKGLLRLSARHEGNYVVIEVQDDGKGMDIEKIKRKAIEKGIATPEELERMSENEVLMLTTLPGFSTSERITEVSGRGVGLDVVKSKVEALNGVLEIQTERGKGTRVIVKLPLTLAIIQALLTKVGEEIYAIPLANIDETLSITPQDIKLVRNQEVILLRGSVLPLVKLHELLEVPVETGKNGGEYAVVVTRVGERRAGLVVDSLIGQQEIVIKSLGKLLKGIKGISGATILGDGKVALILDVVPLIT